MTEGDSANTAADAAPVGPNSGAEALNPTAMTPAALARVLGLPEAAVRTHIERGAPVAPDGTINLVHYAAWLNHYLKQRHDGD